MVGKINTGGLNIHGIVEKYRVAAGGNVKAGDFVEFVNNYEDTFLSNDIYHKAISAVTLNESKVFVAYLVHSSENYTIHGIVYEINETEINARNEYYIRKFWKSSLFYFSSCTKRK